jgi:hypothetical protein
VRPFEPAPDHRRRLRDAAVGGIRHVALHRVGRDVAELGVEMAVIGAAPELAVGRQPKPEPLLQGDRLLDRAVLRPRQLAAVDLAAARFAAQLEQGRGPQQAADMLGAKRRMGAHEGFALTAAATNHNLVGYKGRAEPLCCGPSPPLPWRPS